MPASLQLICAIPNKDPKNYVPNIVYKAISDFDELYKLSVSDIDDSAAFVVSATLLVVVPIPHTHISQYDLFIIDEDELDDSHRGFLDNDKLNALKIYLNF